MSTLRKVYRRLRRKAWGALGRDIEFPVQIDVPHERHGSDCGEWWICPRNVNPGSVVYSLGIGEDITFDVSLIQRHGLIVHAFDPTPGSLAFVESQRLPPGFKYYPFGVAARDGQATFFPPLNPSHISHSLLSRPSTQDRAIQVEIRRLDTIMRDLGHSTIDVLKMDIEGAEYEVIDDILGSGVQIEQILVEFHHRLPSVGIDRTRQAVRKLNEAGYRIFFASESGEEYSFIRHSD